MKKITALMTALAVGACMQVSTAFASESPTCVLMKFTDDTRFDRIESAATLSDLVMEKLLMSGVFNFKETKVVPAVDNNLEQKLYDERAEEFANVKWSMYYGNFTPLFEGDGFNENKAQSIATASVGQYVTPWIIRSIGQTNGADYLIQGTIINIGTGNWMNTKIQNIVNGVNQASALLGSTAAMNLMGALGPLASLAGGFDVKEGAELILNNATVTTFEDSTYRGLSGTYFFISAGTNSITIDQETVQTTEGQVYESPVILTKDTTFKITDNGNDLVFEKTITTKQRNVAMINIPPIFYF